MTLKANMENVVYADYIHNIYINTIYNIFNNAREVITHSKEVPTREYMISDAA